MKRGCDRGVIKKNLAPREWVGPKEPRQGSNVRKKGGVGGGIGTSPGSTAKIQAELKVA